MRHWQCTKGHTQKGRTRLSGKPRRTRTKYAVKHVHQARDQAANRAVRASSARSNTCLKHDPKRDGEAQQQLRNSNAIQMEIDYGGRENENEQTAHWQGKPHKELNPSAHWQGRPHKELKSPAHWQGRPQRR